MCRRHRHHRHQTGAQSGPAEAGEKDPLTGGSEPTTLWFLDMVVKENAVVASHTEGDSKPAKGAALDYPKHDAALGLLPYPAIPAATLNPEKVTATAADKDLKPAPATVYGKDATRHVACHRHRSHQGAAADRGHHQPESPGTKHEGLREPTQRRMRPLRLHISRRIRRGYTALEDEELVEDLLQPGTCGPRCSSSSPSSAAAAEAAAKVGTLKPAVQAGTAMAAKAEAAKAATVAAGLAADGVAAAFLAGDLAASASLQSKGNISLQQASRHGRGRQQEVSVQPVHRPHREQSHHHSRHDRHKKKERHSSRRRTAYSMPPNTGDAQHRIQDLSSGLMDGLPEATTPCDASGLVRSLKALSMEAKQARAELAAHLDQRMCAICMARARDVAFGCGHTVCHVCADQLAALCSPACPECRAKVDVKIKLFL